MASISLDIGKIAKRVGPYAVRVKGAKRFCFRLRIGMAIMRLAALILPVGVTVEVENEARA